MVPRAFVEEDRAEHTTATRFDGRYDLGKEKEVMSMEDEGLQPESSLAHSTISPILSRDFPTDVPPYF